MPINNELYLDSRKEILNKMLLELKDPKDWDLYLLDEEDLQMDIKHQINIVNIAIAHLELE